MRRAVERSLVDLEADDLVLVACSGGADSLALAVAAADCVAAGLTRAGAVVIDHKLQSGSAQTARTAGEQCVELGLSPVEAIAVDVARGPGSGGPEAAARAARREALVSAARRLGAQALLLAHTLDDQAEGVLLGLARGSGPRSLSGMAPRDGLWRRPLLGLRRSDVRSVCAAAGLVAHEDPHNSDSSFARVRVRNDLLPAMQYALGAGIPEALARTAVLMRADVEALDSWAKREFDSRVEIAVGYVTVVLGGGDGTESMATLPNAIRTRILRLALVAGGCPPGSLSAAHLLEADRLVGDWRGQGAARMPADREIRRESGQLVVYPGTPFGSQLKVTDHNVSGEADE